MGKLAKRLIARARSAVGAAYEKVETRILVAQGRKAVRQKAATATMVGEKAAKTGLIVGVMTAAGVIVHEIRKRRNRD